MAVGDGYDWIDHLVDGETLDWQALERALGEESPALARMRRMAVLCAALNAAHPLPGPPQPDHATSGFRWGHLRVLARVGEGSSGEVYRAFDTVLEREVALKLVDGELLQGRAFLAEARRLAQVRHANVLAVHGAAIHDGHAGLWADLIIGRSLRAWVDDEGARPLAEVLAAGKALASALAAVHAAGLVHGDVKSSNVMREDGDGRIILMDFGSAGSRAEAGRHGLFGSPLSMAPEQLLGEPVGPAADLYGLGVVLFHLCTGRLPVTAVSVSELEQAHVADCARAAALAMPATPRALRHLLARLLAADAGLRPDATAVVEELQRIAQAPRRRRRLAFVTMVVSGLSLALGVALWQGRLAAEHALSAVQTKDFIVSMFDDFRLFERPEGAELSVREMIVAAIPRLESELSDAPASQAEIRAQFGVALSDLGALSQAQPLLLRSVDQLRDLAPDSSELVRVLSALVIVELFRGELDAAADAIAQAKRILNRWPDERAAEVRLHRLHLGSSEFGVASQRGRYDQALEIGEAVRRDRAAALGASHPDVAGDWNNLGRVYLQLDRFPEAERAYREALAILDSGVESPGPRHVWLRAGLGVALLGAGRYTEAEVELQQVQELAERVLGPEHFMVANVLGHQAWLSARVGDYHRADELFERALAIEAAQQVAERRLTELRWALTMLESGRNEAAADRLRVVLDSASDTVDEPVTASARVAYGLAVARLGRVAEAEVHARAGLSALERLNLSGHSRYGRATLQLSEILFLQGRNDEAQQLREEAIALLSRLLGPEHPEIRALAAEGTGRAALRRAERAPQ